MKTHYVVILMKTIIICVCKQSKTCLKLFEVQVCCIGVELLSFRRWINLHFTCAIRTFLLYHQSSIKMKTEPTMFFYYSNYS